jgi:Tfp pilus assembly protein PilO
MATGWKKDYFRYKEFFLNVLNLYNTKPNLRIYLELTLSIFTIIIFAIFAIKPTILTVIELNNEIKSKTALVQELNTKIKNLQTAGQILQTNASDLLYLEQALPDTAKPDNLVKQFEVLALESNVKIVGISSSDVIINGKSNDKKKSGDQSSIALNADELAFSISISGDYQSLINYLTKLESLRRPLKIDSIAINSTNTDNGKVISLLINSRTPYLNEKN